MNEVPTAEELLPMVQRACETPVETEPFFEYWGTDLYVGDRSAGALVDSRMKKEGRNPSCPTHHR